MLLISSWNPGAVAVTVICDSAQVAVAPEPFVWPHVHENCVPGWAPESVTVPAFGVIFASASVMVTVPLATKPFWSVAVLYRGGFLSSMEWSPGAIFPKRALPSSPATPSCVPSTTIWVFGGKPWIASVANCGIGVKTILTAAVWPLFTSTSCSAEAS